MKKRIRNLAAIVAAISVAGAALVGCGSENSSAGPAPADAQTAADNAGTGNTETGSGNGGAGEVTTIRVHVSSAPAPYLYLDSGNNPDGFDFAVFKEAVSRLPQYNAEYIVADDGLTGVLSGIYDVTIGNWVYREERGESYYFSYPYKVTDKAFVQRTDDEPLKDLHDAAARGYSVIVGASGGDTSALEQWNEDHPDEQIKIIYSDAEVVVRYQNVADGVADFTLDDGPMISAYFEEYEIDGVQKVALSDEALSDILPTVNTYYLFAKDENGFALREDIDGAIKEMYEDGTLEALSIEYFGYETTPAAEDFESTIN